MIKAAALRAGSLFALEQAGHLLNDALLLYSERRYASGLALAVFAREEIGRSQLLAELAVRAEGGELVTAPMVKAACDEHEKKLKLAYTGVSIAFNAAEGAHILPVLGNRSHPDHAKVRAAFDRRVRTIRGQMPKQNHAARMRSVYVDLTTEGDWNRPANVSRAEAFEILNQAAGDYAMCRDRVWQADPVPPEVRSWLAAHELPPGDFPDA
jgi:AbiV family abortive infection protein